MNLCSTSFFVSDFLTGESCVGGDLNAKDKVWELTVTADGLKNFQFWYLSAQRFEDACVGAPGNCMECFSPMDC